MLQSFSTDTASMCIFDFQQLKHRLVSSCDWWANRFEEIKELNKGNVIIIGLLSDGRYKYEFKEGSHFTTYTKSIVASLKCSSGRIFIGAGEDITGDDMEPDADDGYVVDIKPGNYAVQICILDDEKLGVAFLLKDTESVNHFGSQLVLSIDQDQRGRNLSH